MDYLYISSPWYYYYTNKCIPKCISRWIRFIISWNLQFALNFLMIQSQMYSASPFYFNLEKGQPFKFYLGPYTEELLLVYYSKIISRLPFPVVPITMPEYAKLFTKKCFEFEKILLMLFLSYLFLIYIIHFEERMILYSIMNSLMIQALM